MTSRPVEHNGRRAAVLGAGVMGASVAIFLARRGYDVTLVDAAAAPLSCASRWNEGKIHLGYLYSGDPTLATAKRLIPGALAFADVMRELIGHGLETVTSSHDELYLIHRESVAGQAQTARYFDAVSTLVRAHPDADRYLVDVTRAKPQPLDRGDLAAMADPAVIVAGYRVPERSVRTTVIADALVRALESEPRISLLTSTRVHAVAPEGTAQQAWRLETDPAVHGTFDWVINALWEGRLPIDSSVGFRPEHPWSNRYRLSLFIETSRPVPFPSFIVATGPFGDVKSYDGRNFYVSWYPAGLVVENHDLAPQRPSVLDTIRRERFIAAVRTGITGIVPAADEIFAAATRVAIEGGWVFAYGQGTLDDPAASLHRRDRFGVRRLGSYVSVDTGKYSTAPWLARRLAAEIAGEQVQAV